MSVYIITVGERGQRFSGVSYAVQADNSAEASEYALGFHAIDEKVNPNDLHVTDIEKTSARCVLVVEIVPSEAPE